MARRPSKHLRPPRPLSTSFSQSQPKTDGEWVVRSVTGAQSTKRYLCPGCNREIDLGEPHLVAWPHLPAIGTSSGLDSRRHWHHACWARRP